MASRTTSLRGLLFLICSLSSPVSAAAAPTLAFDHPCYVPGQSMVITGGGYTPNGPVDVFVSRLGTALEPLGVFAAAADQAGALSLTITAPDLARGSLRDDDAAAANDRLKLEAGAGPQDAVASATFQVSATHAYVPQWDDKPPSRRKKITVAAKGFAFDVGRMLYAHYVRNGKSLGDVAVGILGGDCGDLDTRMKQFPAGLKPGRYTVAFNATRRWARADWADTWRVTKLRPRSG
jgi:hypothetical protein